MAEGLKILNAEIKNFKNISYREVDFGDGRSVMIFAPNRKGKSSFLQALMTPLDASYKPLSPIKEGEERGSIELMIGGTIGGEKKKYNVEMYFSQDNQKGRLILTDEGGSRIPNPKTALDAILGNISFDIYEFIQMSKTRTGGFSKEGALKQIEILKGLLPKEVRVELMNCDIRIKETQDARKDLNKEIKEMTEKLKHDYSDEDLKLYSKTKEIEPIEEKMKTIGESTQRYTNAENVKKKLEEEIAAIKKDIAIGVSIKDAEENIQAIDQMRDQIKPANNQIVTIFMAQVAKFRAQMTDIIEKAAALPQKETDLEKTSKWLEKTKKPTMDDIMNELKDANKHNEHCKAVAELKQRYIDLDKKKKQYDEMEEIINETKEIKRKIFSLNHLKVKGLSFDEEQVLYQDLPFNEEQHASSTIIGVGIKIAMLMNPNLKVLIIKDGSLLDKETANQILKMAEKYGYQLFIEMVSWEDQEMQINFIEKEITI